MKLLPDQQRVKTLLADTITLLCKNGLNYNSEFCIDALIGITVDQSQVFLVNINETIGKDLGVLVKNSTDNKPKKRKPVENGGSGLDRLVNGDYNSNSSGGVSRNKIPRFHEGNIKPKSRSSPSPVNKDVSKSLSNNREGTSNDYVVVTHDNSETLQSNNKKSLFSSSYDHSNSYKDKGHVQIKPEADLEEQENESEIAMQLLYSQSDNAEEESDISNVEHQVTGPPVWPEPTLSFSSGLTMPTVIAPESGPQSSPCNTPSTDDTTPNQANVSQGLQQQRSIQPLRIQLQPDSPFRKHCSVCGRGFKEAWMVKRHMLTHSLPGFFCPHCNKPFKRKDTMRMHIIKSHPEEASGLLQSNKASPSKYSTMSSGVGAMSNSLGLEIEDVRTDLALESDISDIAPNSVNNAWKHLTHRKDNTTMLLDNNENNDDDGNDQLLNTNFDNISCEEDNHFLDTNKSNEVVQPVSWGNLTLINEPVEERGQELEDDSVCKAQSENYLESSDMIMSTKEHQSSDLKEGSNMVTLPYYSDSSGDEDAAATS